MICRGFPPGRSHRHHAGQGEIVQIGRPADIVLEPADDYVARFAEDIPLVRVMPARDIMRPANGAAAARRSSRADHNR